MPSGLIYFFGLKVFFWLTTGRGRCRRRRFPANLARGEWRPLAGCWRKRDALGGSTPGGLSGRWSTSSAGFWCHPDPPEGGDIKRKMMRRKNGISRTHRLPMQVFTSMYGKKKKRKAGSSQKWSKNFVRAKAVSYMELVQHLGNAQRNGTEVLNALIQPESLNRSKATSFPDILESDSS